MPCRQFPAANSNDNDGDAYVVEPWTYSGLTLNEHQVVLSAVESVCEASGVAFRAPRDQNELASLKIPGDLVASESFVGATGRVMLLRGKGPDDTASDDDEWRVALQYAISEQLDHTLYNVSNDFNQPVVIRVVESTSLGSNPDEAALLGSILLQEATDYDLCVPLKQDDSNSLSDLEVSQLTPSIHVEIDGAVVPTTGAPLSAGDTKAWDTSTILVFDNLVDEILRRELLEVLNSGSAWDDLQNGPDPNRWIRGGLVDVPDTSKETSADCEDDSPAECVGLSHEAIMDLCEGEHEAIQEFERRLVALFPQFHVCRLPEAILGSTVSPLTANAPTYGDTFDYHIDADPLQAPPSPWTDVYGRYPNRAPGKPRFMSCLVYLNEDWKDEWGAPTRFLDPPTQETYEVIPRPGRVCLMDQDVSHTVTAPVETAGHRPRYSLVWKLLLHPKVAGQDMTELFVAGRPAWPVTTLVGSAAVPAS